VFGRGNDELLREGAEAKGVVIETKMRSNVEGRFEPNYRVKVRVKFEDGSTAEFKQKLNKSKDGLHFEGGIVPVRYDTADHSKIIIDLPAIALPEVDREARKAEAISIAEDEIAKRTRPSD
jgi:hypothetical protein